MKNFLKSIAFAVVLAIIAFTSAFTATASPPGKTNSISSIQTRYIVQTQSPRVSVTTVQDSVLNDAGAFSTNETPGKTEQTVNDQTANRRTGFYDATNFSPPDSSRTAFAPNINASPPDRFIAAQNRRPIQRE